MVHAVDADRVVDDEAARLADDRAGDALEVLEVAEAPGELGDRGQAVGEGCAPSRRAGALPMAVAMWSPKARASARSSAVQS